jgi:hypothetical protein
MASSFTHSSSGWEDYPVFDINIQQQWDDYIADRGSNFPYLLRLNYASITITSGGDGRWYPINSINASIASGQDLGLSRGPSTSIMPIYSSLGDARAAGAKEGSFYRNPFDTQVNVVYDSEILVDSVVE